MIEIGKFNILEVARIADFGYYLTTEGNKSDDDVLLPTKSALGRELSIGDEVEAFIYRDSKDRIIATLKTPYAKVGDVSYLEVVDTTSFGAFLDIGLERDVFVPHKEQSFKLKKGEKYLFYIYLDKTGRIAATTKVDDFLETNTDYPVGKETYGIVYDIQQCGNLLVAVEGKYRGIVLKSEYYTYVYMGEDLKLTVKKFYDDDRIGLTTRKRKLEERDILQDRILNYLKENNGFMTYNDKSSAIDIRKEFNTSKNYFKIALGGLMKKNLISQDKNGTKLL